MAAAIPNAIGTSSSIGEIRAESGRSSKIVDFVFELPDFQNRTAEESVFIAPSEKPIEVKVRAHVVTGAAQALRSAEFYASVRRTGLSAIRKEITALKVNENQEKFALYTFAIVEKIGEILCRLTDAETEGNVREVLRQVRDTFFDGGWNQYKNQRSRQAVVHFLEKLEQHEEILPRHVNECFEMLFDSGLNVVPSVTLHGQTQANTILD